LCETGKVKFREIVVSNRFGRFMWSRGWAGFTMPVPYMPIVFYWCLPGHIPHPRTIIHEREHVAQIAQYGWFGFTWRYLWQLVRYGYRNNPFEVSARAAEEKIPHLSAV
jgi:hypothetical protein